MQQKKILITGGSGFIGHNLCLKLKDEGHEVIVADKFEADFIKQNSIRFIQSELTEESIDSFHKVDSVIHLASSAIPESKDILKDVQQNVENSIRLLDYCVQSKVKQFVFMSSGGTVYGNPLYSPIDEQHQTEPICTYGVSKLAIEKYVRLYHEMYSLNTAIVRLSNPYGRFQNPYAKQGIVPIFCRKAMNDEEIQIFGDGKNERDYICIDDVCSAISRIVQFDNNIGVVNLGSGVGTTINDILCYISKALNKKLDVKYVDKRSFDVKSNVLDIAKICNLLDWEPEVRIEDGIRRYVKSLVK